MDIREVSKEEKEGYIKRVTDVFGDIRNMLDTLEVDMISSDLVIQASSVWIAGNLCSWYNDFMTQIRALDQQQKTLKGLQSEIQDVVESDNKVIN